MLAILDNHSKIKAVPYESHIFYKSIFAKIKKFNEWNRMTILSGKSRWAEKTPLHIYKIEEIYRFFPHAQIILLLRDGRDVACSLRARAKNYERGVEYGATRWVKDNHAGQVYCSNGQVLVIKYEDLVHNMYHILRIVFEFLGESFEPEFV